MSEPAELKPCKLCGAHACHFAGQKGRIHYVSCSEPTETCKSEVFTDRDETDARAKWNAANAKGSK